MLSASFFCLHSIWEGQAGDVIGQNPILHIRCPLAHCILLQEIGQGAPSKDLKRDSIVGQIGRCLKCVSIVGQTGHCLKCVSIVGLIGHCLKLVSIVGQA